MTYTDYLSIKKAVIEEDATVNYVVEKLNVPLIVARCLVKDWKEQQEEIERLDNNDKQSEKWFMEQYDKAARYELSLKDIVEELNRYCSEGWTTKALEIAKKSIEDSTIQLQNGSKIKPMFSEKVTRGKGISL